MHDKRVCLVIDGNSLFARSYFSAKNDPVLNLEFGDRGVQIRFFGTVFSLLSPLSRRLPETPTELLFCWDGKEKRDKMRQPKPPDYHDHIDFTRRCCEEMLGAENWVSESEADDACATACSVLSADSSVAKIYVASGDKDLFQLVGGKVSYYCFNQKAILPQVTITSKFHVKKPEQVAIALAIIGDKTDAIKGVSKWGPKKVEQIFQQVDDRMTLAEVAEFVAARIPDDKLSEFEESLELTLLNRFLPGYKSPKPVRYGSSETLELLGLQVFQPNTMMAAGPSFGPQDFEE